MKIVTKVTVEKEVEICIRVGNETRPVSLAELREMGFVRTAPVAAVPKTRRTQKRRRQNPKTSLRSRLNYTQETPYIVEVVEAVTLLGGKAQFSAIEKLLDKNLGSSLTHAVNCGALIHPSRGTYMLPLPLPNEAYNGHGKTLDRLAD